MQRDNMTQNTNIKIRELNKLISMLGINANDIEHIIENSTAREEDIYLSAGPGPWDPYWSSYYGTTSIKDF